MTRNARKAYPLSELVARFGGEIAGDGSISVSQIAPLQSAKAGDISFITDSRYQRQLQATRASAVILGRDLADVASIPYIVCDNPYAYYARVCALLNPADDHPPGIHARASVSSTARLGDGVYIQIGGDLGDH